MSKTKENILEVARKMFNEHGYWNVTIRMIATELGISPGNLNYHFRKREDILEALYFQMVETFDQRIIDLPNTEISFHQIKTDILTSMERMIDYRFIWTDLYRLLNNYDQIYQHFSNTYRKRIDGNLYLYMQLNELALMRGPSIEGEFEMLAQRMVNFGDTWIYTSEVYRKKSTAEYLTQQCTAMLMMLYPYLTKKGADSLLKVIEEE